ncbi:hypothetical protein PTKIN_Ptkin16aG0537000 [Pterospermum kingtungense]
MKLSGLSLLTRLPQIHLKVPWSLRFSIHVAVVILLLCFDLNGPCFLGSSALVINGNETDRQALLQFKAKIIDPLGILRSWNDSVHFCQWRGVKCGWRHQRVTGLVLQKLKLMGPISPYIGNLSFLRGLDLQNNSFFQELPQEIVHLRRLEKLFLERNSIGGEIPSNISSCSKLTHLYIGHNLLVGEIPAAIGHLSNLKALSFQNNTLSGSIPPFLGNLSSLKIFSLIKNRFSGVIPEALGQLKNLTFFSMGFNEMSGMVPSSLFNLSNIRTFDIGENNFHGTFPSQLGVNMPYLEYFSVGFNQFSGPFPLSIANASNLIRLEVVQNKFTGKLSSFRKLEKLQVFNIAGNLLGSNNANDLNFLCSLTNATSLELVDIGENNFGGVLSECISNLSTSIKRFTVQKNNIVGRIPTGFGNLINLEMLAASTNQLSGSIPSIIGRLQKLQTFFVGDNALSKAIPTSLGNLTMLINLDLSYNNLQGEIPPSLGKCEELNLLTLSNNNLSGSIPPQIVGLSSLSILLFLSSNRLTGMLPIAVGKLINLGILDVSQNMLSGVIPNDLGNCIRLEVLLMGGNFFQGSIPSSLSSLRGLTKLDLSRNNLTGAILVFSLILLLRFRKKRKYTASANEENPLRLSYQSILKATNSFSSETLIGEGSFGFVYKGVLEDGKIIAIKVLKLLSHGASRSFLAECEALRNVRHRNLVKVLTACSGVDYNGNDFKALVYEFMANGSLEDRLHPPIGINDGEEAAKSLNLFQRLNVVIDVSYALEYLHHHCETPIVHCDLKPSNILLDDEMVGHVGDFGLAKFITSDLQNHTSSQSSSLGFRGTIGYAPPEYGLGSTVTTYGDVYSYGILFLEMFTMRRPTDEMFKENLNLHSFVKTALPNHVVEITDPILLQESFRGETRINNTFNERSQKENTLLWGLTSIFEIGVACSSELPTERMNMVNVVAQLSSIKKKLFPIRLVRTRGNG